MQVILLGSLEIKHLSSGGVIRLFSVIYLLAMPDHGEQRVPDTCNSTGMPGTGWMRVITHAVYNKRVILVQSLKPLSHVLYTFYVVLQSTIVFSIYG